MSKPGSPQTTYLAGDDPETIAANRAYQDALSKLTDSLNSRKNRLFDPVLLAAAQGFLAPTQTGSFGESLGNAAAKIGAAESAAFKEPLAALRCSGKSRVRQWQTGSYKKSRPVPCRVDKLALLVNAAFKSLLQIQNV